MTFTDVTEDTNAEARPSTTSSKDAAPKPGLMIVLQVGERKFTTTKETLEESGFFDALLSGRWVNQHSPDGSYFIDADPDLFAHILRYLRRGVLPVIWTKENGHNYPMYTALHEEAKYFQINRLEEWFEKKLYLQAVVIRYRPIQILDHGYISTEVDVETHIEWSTKRVYLCPRGISVHRGDPVRCGRACMGVQGANGPAYDEEKVPKIYLIEKAVVFNHKRVTEWDYESGPPRPFGTGPPPSTAPGPSAGAAPTTSGP